MGLLDVPGKHRVKRLQNYFLFSTSGIFVDGFSYPLQAVPLFLSPCGFFYRNGLTDRYTLGFILSTKIIQGKLAEVMQENSLSLFLKKLDWKLESMKIGSFFVSVYNTFIILITTVAKCN